MLMQASHPSTSAHVIVIGNEKGGSGKSTVAVHLAVALLKAGHRVATIDLDCRQQTLTHYINNRSAWRARAGLDLEVPVHHCLELGGSAQLIANDDFECRQLVAAADALEGRFDFVVIDTPGSDSYLARMAHAMADTIISPLNDSLLDLDVLGRFAPSASGVDGVGHYAGVVRNARRQRRQLDGVDADWIVVRNRLAMLESRNNRTVADRLRELSIELGFVPLDGFVERTVYREYFLRGLTALDPVDEKTIGTKPNATHEAARNEVTGLVERLKLPMDERGRRRASNRAAWFGRSDEPLVLDEILSP